ncbi:hypothetical protein BER2_1367 [plant metagenome]|uniref:Uncharacterized protein n=1 Tax=plant metagenome TaxID=1297885 RepID=A0A484RA82_9ZZZZ
MRAGPAFRPGAGFPWRHRQARPAGTGYRGAKAAPSGAVFVIEANDTAGAAGPSGYTR